MSEEAMEVEEQVRDLQRQKKVIGQFA